MDIGWNDKFHRYHMALPVAAPVCTDHVWSVKQGTVCVRLFVVVHVVVVLRSDSVCLICVVCACRVDVL